jgi:geranylgeranyl pyrophosphate synthase
MTDRQLAEFQMDDRERSVSEELDYQLATRYFASAFEHLDRLPAEDQRSLLREINIQISERQAAAALRGE